MRPSAKLDGQLRDSTGVRRRLERDGPGREALTVMTMCLLPNLERAGMSETDIYNRPRDVFLHFKLPYDAPPPEE